jgi:hypothetical protein
MADAEIQEAATTVLQSVGVSAYLHGVGYSLEKWKKELGAAVNYIKSQAK